MKSYANKKNIIIMLLAIICSSILIPNSSLAQLRQPISSDSLHTLFSQMSPFEVFDSVPYGYIDFYDCFHNTEVRQQLVRWLDKEQYFDYEIQKSLRIAFSDEEVKKNKVAGWLIMNKKRELIDTVLNTPTLYAHYLDTVINHYIQYHRQDFYQHGAKLPPDVLNFFSFCRLPEAYEIIYRYWEVDDKTKQSSYFLPLLSMHSPEALIIANEFVDSIIAIGDFRSIHQVNNLYANRVIYGSYRIDWKLKLLNVTAKTSSPFNFSDEPRFEVPFNIYLLNPFQNHFLLQTDNIVVKNIINKLFNPIDKIYELSPKELESISLEIIENIHEFEKAVQPYKDKLKEEEKYWKVNMPYSK